MHGHPEYLQCPFDVGECTMGLAVARAQAEMALEVLQAVAGKSGIGVPDYGYRIHGLAVPEGDAVTVKALLQEGEIESSVMGDECTFFGERHEILPD